MKTAYVSLVIGVLLVVVFLIGGATELSDPSEISRINLAILLTNISWVLLGLFLIFRFFKRKEEDAKNVTIEPDSTEDRELLNSKQNRIFGYVLILAFIGSIEVWTLNNYFAGLTVLNLSSTFDLVMNLVLAGITVQLFRNKNVSKLLLFSTLVYCIGTIIFETLRGEWVGVVASVLFTAYITYSVLRPLNQKTYRISHFILLPAVIILVVAALSFDGGKETKLWNDFYQAEEIYIVANGDTNVAYQIFVEEEKPTQGDIDDLKAKLEISNDKINNIILNLNILQEELQAQRASKVQILSLEIIGSNLEYYNLALQQIDTVVEYVNYADSLNYENLSDFEIDRLGEFGRKVEEFNTAMNDIALKISYKQEDLAE